MLLTPAASAETKIVVDSPLERQVFQRNAQEWAAVKVAGAVPADATLVEARAELEAGLRGRVDGIAGILAAQKALWDKGVAYRGPDTNDLIGNADYRHDGIHFGPRGLLVHAERWYAALSAHYQWANPVSSKSN